MHISPSKTGLFLERFVRFVRLVVEVFALKIAAWLIFRLQIR